MPKNNKGTISFLTRVDFVTKIFFLCVVFVGLIFIFSPHYISSGLVLEAWAIDQNITLYKEIASFHLPLGRFVLLFLNTLTNWNLSLTPFLGLFTAIINLYLIQDFSKKYLSKISSVIALLFFTAFYWYVGTGVMFYHEQLIGLFLTISIITVYKDYYTKRFTLKSAFIVGLFLSLAGLAGQVSGITVATIFLIYLLLLMFHKLKISFFIYYFLGVSIPIAIVSLYFISRHAFFDLIYWNFLYYSDYAKMTGSILGIPRLDLLVFFSPFLVITFGIFLASKEHRKRGLLVTYLILVLSTIPFIVFSVFHPHHYSYALPIMAIVLGLSLTSIEKSNEGRKLPKLFLLAFGFYFIFQIMNWHITHYSLTLDFRIRNDFQKNSSDIEVVNWLIANSDNNTKIFVIGNPLVYVKTNLPPSSRPAHSMPFSWVPFDEIKKEVLISLPKYLITDTNFVVRFARDYNQKEMSDFINDLITKCFKKVYEVDTWQVYEKNCNKY